MFPIVNVTLMLSYILNNNDAFFIPGQQTKTMVKIIPSLFWNPSYCLLSWEGETINCIVIRLPHSGLIPQFFSIDASSLTNHTTVIARLCMFYDLITVLYCVLPYA